MEEDPRYATLRGEYRKWGWDDIVEEYLDPIETHPCSDDELGIVYDQEQGEHVINYEDRSKTKFYVTRSQSHYDITQYRKKFKCFSE